LYGGFTSAIGHSRLAGIRAGKLQVVLPKWVEGEPGIYAVLNRNRYVTPRVRVLLDFLVDCFQRAISEASWQRRRRHLLRKTWTNLR
jgi:DNA-binding transcriptional LysR family regulator